ncbi:MAG TPA: NADH-quinone oxidoreductase subunit C [Syntrophomonas sp.]|nr:NADH-quinone oxidoreductase subunit C [Syntrophomonas sp.]
MDDILKDLQERFPDSLQVSQDEWLTYLLVKPESVQPLMTELKDKHGFNHLANLCAVDYNEEFEVIYHLYSIPLSHRISVKTRVPRDKAQVSSLVEIYPTADWQEREAYDLMGIIFTGHPNLIRVLLPDDFVGHPLRKDFTMKG